VRRRLGHLIGCSHEFLDKLRDVRDATLRTFHVRAGVGTLEVFEIPVLPSEADGRRESVLVLGFCGPPTCEGSSPSSLRTSITIPGARGEQNSYKTLWVNVQER